MYKKLKNASDRDGYTILTQAGSCAGDAAEHGRVQRSGGRVAPERALRQLRLSPDSLRPVRGSFPGGGGRG